MSSGHHHSDFIDAISHLANELRNLYLRGGVAVAMDDFAKAD
jgi:hypothetical protein